MSFLDPELTSIAICWRIERRDGVCAAFTTHDRDLTIGHLCYRAAPGMVPSSISLTDGFDTEALEISGALTSDAITARDLAEGRWDGAAVRIFMVDWQAPEGEQVPLARGELGDISNQGPSFTAELRGATFILDRPVVEQTSPECRAELGDKRCRIDMAGRITITRVTGVAEDNQIEVERVTGGANAFAYGRLRWISGPNGGLESEIVVSEGTLLTLRDAPPHEPQLGTLVEIREGCDKRFETCWGRFANAVNFRGEPYLPGMDLLTRYPGA